MFTIQKSELAAALSLVNAAVERRNTIPILANVLIAPADGGIRATGTNLDVEVSVSARADVEAPFAAFTVPAVTLRDIIAKLGDGPVKFEHGRADIVLRSGRSRFALQCLPGSDFPTIAAGDMPARIELDADAIMAAMKGISFAISTEETRYYLNGIYMHRAGDGRLALVATDGHRLALRFLTLDTDVPDFPGIIIPTKTVNVLMKQLAEHDRLEIEISEAKIRVTSGNSILVSKLIDGTFPDYVRVIPARNETSVVIGRQALDAAVGRVATLTGERGKAVKFAFGDGQLRLTVANPDSGSAEEDLPVEGMAALETGFNGKYVGEALANIDGDSVEFLLDEPGSPAILRKPGEDGDLVVLMPMRV